MEVRFRVFCYRECTEVSRRGVDLMPKRAKTKTAIEVRRLTAPGIYAIGEVARLQLRVKHAAARSWILRVMVASGGRTSALGRTPPFRWKRRATRPELCGG